MKPIIFDSQNRISLTFEDRGGTAKIPIEAYEIRPWEMKVLCHQEPFLRGKISFKGRILEVNLRDSLRRSGRVEAVFSFSDGGQFYTDLLKSLPPDQLTNWLIDLPSSKSSSTKESYPEGHSEEGLPSPPQDISRAIEKLLVFFYQKPALVLSFLFLMSLFPVYQLKNLKVDPGLDRVLVQGSELMKQYDRSLELFGSDKSAILYFKDDAIFTKEKLTLLQNLTWKLQKNPQVARVRSVFTTTFIRYERDDDTLYTEPLFTDLEFSKQKLIDKLNRVQKDPNLHGRLIDVPKKTLVIVLELAPEVSGLLKIAEELNPEIEELKPHFDQAFQSGEPTVELFQKEEMARNPKIFMPLICLVLLVCFVFFLGSASAFVITMVATCLSLVWTFGWMTFLDIPIQIMITLVPGVILTLSATEIVHVASSLKAATEKELSPVDSLRFLARDIGKALLLTFSTTALGFLSVRFSEIQMLQEFAIVSTMGLIFAFLITLLYTPLHIRFFGLSRKDSRQSLSHALFDRFKIYFVTLYTNLLFSQKAVFFILLFIGFNAFYATKVFVDNDTFGMIANRAQVKKNLLTFKEEMGGMKNIHAVFEFQNIAKEEGAQFTRSQNLKLLWDIHNDLLEFPETESIDSFSGLIALLNQEMREGDPTYYRTPSSQPLIDQYFIMLSRDDVDPLLSSDKQIANIKIAHDLSSSRETEKFVKKLNSYLKEKLKEQPITFHLTSRNILNLHAANTLVDSQTSSLLTMSLVIIVLIGLFFRSFSAGIISLIPNFFPIFGLFGIMGYLGIPLNVGTCIVATITIGIAADDTIHLFTRFFRDKEIHHNPMSSSFLTIKDEITPILTTSLSLALSFAFFAFARFTPMMYFGLLSSYVLLLAVISDLYLGPALLTRFFTAKEKSKEFMKWMLIRSDHFKKGALFDDMRTAEVTDFLSQSRVIATWKPKEKLNEDGQLYLPLMARDTYIYLSLSEDKLSQLNPSTFEKIRHNLKELNVTFND